MLEQPFPQIINLKGDDLTLLLRRERTYLPFSLELVDFKKELHPGTGIAKSFSSKINLYEKQIIQSEDVGRSVIIRMNQPLRYKNYTFYQSSFIEDFDTETTILSVVKNYGRVFPYISSIIISTVNMRLNLDSVLVYYLIYSMFREIRFDHAIGICY